MKDSAKVLRLVLCADCDNRARQLHDAYEAAAAEEGWETQRASRKPWASVPDANKRTMVKALNALWPCSTCRGHGRLIGNRHDGGEERTP